MLKRARHAAILKLIEDNVIGTQKDLLSKLNEMGYNMTQATISRDIRQLHLVRICDVTDHTYRYVRFPGEYVDVVPSSGFVSKSESRGENSRRKYERQMKIHDLIESGEVRTQQDIVDALKKMGIDVRQATVSRDLQQMDAFTHNMKMRQVNLASKSVFLNNNPIRIYTEAEGETVPAYLQRDIIMLANDDDMSYAKIANVTCVPVASVKRIVKRYRNGGDSNGD